MCCVLGYRNEFSGVPALLGMAWGREIDMGINTSRWKVMGIRLLRVTQEGVPNSS